jgi:hypothetical protein
MSNWADACSKLSCAVCCKSVAVLDNSAALTNFTCTSDGLTCKLKAHGDFGILVTTFLILLGFAIGNLLTI